MNRSTNWTVLSKIKRMIDAKSVYVNRTFACKADSLFEWLSRPELIVKWFGPQGLTVGKIENELVVGGSYSIELKRNDNFAFKVMGEYTHILKPKSLNFTYRYAGLSSPPPPSVVRITLQETSAESTSLALVQEFESPSPDMEKRTEVWNYMLALLENILNNGPN